ncbi:MAG: GIY-YIG nuclease family protein, partial [Lachnospiraceae bacterium]|nr:GIY-YIG nuclease family protein [Candidatus Minthocola equi]
VMTRLTQLNRSECTLFAFRVYATYEVSTRLTDKKIHDVIDKLNPDLRSIDTVNGKKRVREFYAMSKEDAYDLLEAIAAINGFEKNLKLWKQTEEEKAAEKTAEEIEEQQAERYATFRFSICNIGVGEQVEFCYKNNSHSGELFTVVDDKHVTYDGENWSLTALAKHLINAKGALAGPKYFKYKGEWLNDIRRRLGK